MKKIVLQFKTNNASHEKNKGIIEKLRYCKENDINCKIIMKNGYKSICQVKKIEKELFAKGCHVYDFSLLEEEYCFFDSIEKVEIINKEK